MVGATLCVMIDYLGTEAKEEVNRTLKVYGLARAIGLRENLDSERQQILECAAALHRIGLPECRRVYGDRFLAEHVEAMSAKIAGEMLGSLGFPAHMVERIVFLVAHHRSRSLENSTMLQILCEAVSIVCLEEGSFSRETSPLALREQVFQTKAGLDIFNTVFNIPHTSSASGF